MSCSRSSSAPGHPRVLGADHRHRGQAACCPCRRGCRGRRPRRAGTAGRAPAARARFLYPPCPLEPLRCCRAATAAAGGVASFFAASSARRRLELASHTMPDDPDRRNVSLERCSSAMSSTRELFFSADHHASACDLSSCYWWLVLVLSARPPVPIYDSVAARTTGSCGINAFDFCVADLKAATTPVDGFPCKPASTVVDDDFFSRAITASASTRSNPFGVNATRATASTFPGLNTLGLSITRVDMAPGGLNPPHSHPRASELVMVLKGEVTVGFTTSANQLFSQGDSSSLANSTPMVILSAVIASVVSEIGLGSDPAFTVPEYDFRSPTELPLYLLLGVFCGLVSIALSRCTSLAIDTVGSLQKATGLPKAASPALGGLIVGLLALMYPEVLYWGFENVDVLLESRPFTSGLTATVLVQLIGVKILATSLCRAFGLVGGYYAPSLFIGAATGMAYGKFVRFTFTGPEPLLHIPFLDVASPQAYGLVGMAATLAGVCKVPLTSVLLLFELTQDYRIVLPLLGAVGLSSWITSPQRFSKSNRSNLNSQEQKSSFAQQVDKSAI
ncbi:hypothetical protein PR202_gb05042 [Eleusine coracana subsp. coracana]|uniref:Cupin type-1 domain-containing protein n=1 Tax=Eleusine coracana subsp. coracana TaxID=191504 RepID=A0AAV5E4E9_ELECO|nr:hypothetical protein PR202_gb05042 [Eleusine coracana subsp. coracana]